MKKSKVVVAPIRFGAGVQNKVLEAMGLGKAVVSTSVGCEGIEVTDDKNICIEDSEKGFANKIIELIENKERRQKLGEEGLKLVKERYQWEKIAELIENEYEKVIQNFKGK